ncbi:MAG: prepilin-type N-terminal cleavage/methylation domain-containing protein [Verrucomicrobia bacterium]|nr:prepilin-type N-terminal cleavage/methylation domain-containing protein [Verrucomicrobiota bacterium]
MHQPRHGFTLIEVLVSMTLGLIVVMAALSLLGRARDDYVRIGGGVSAEQEARAALTQLTADLNSASFHQDSVFEHSPAASGDRLGFLSLQAPDAQSATGRIGDLCAIHYYLKDLVINSKTVRCLMRGFRESHATFQALRDFHPASLFTATERDEPVAFGILGFEARPQSRDASGRWHDWEISTTEAPAALAVRLVIARRELVAKLADSAAWDAASPAAKLVGPAPQAATSRNLEVYATLIRFGCHAAQ